MILTLALVLYSLGTLIRLLMLVLRYARGLAPRETDPANSGSPLLD